MRRASQDFCYFRPECLCLKMNLKLRTTQLESMLLRSRVTEYKTPQATLQGLQWVASLWSALPVAGRCFGGFTIDRGDKPL